MLGNLGARIEVPMSDVCLHNATSYLGGLDDLGFSLKSLSEVLGEFGDISKIISNFAPNIIVGPMLALDDISEAIAGRRGNNGHDGTFNGNGHIKLQKKNINGDKPDWLPLTKRGQTISG